METDRKKFLICCSILLAGIFCVAGCGRNAAEEGGSIPTETVSVGQEENGEAQSREADNEETTGQAGSRETDEELLPRLTVSGTKLTDTAGNPV